MEVNNSMRIDKFSGINFRQWKFQVNCALKAKGLNIKKEKPNVADTTQWEKDDGMAMFIITSSMDLCQISLIENCETAKEIMSKLESIYEAKSELNKMMVHEKFYQYKMLPTDSIAKHIAKVENLAKQLKESGEEISDTAIMTKVLSTLPAKYRSLRQAWLSLDPKSQTIHNLTARLLDEEASLTNEEEAESALIATKYSTKNNKPQKQQNIHHNSKSGQQSNHRFICYNCNKRGHFARDCRAPKKSRGNTQEQKPMAFSVEQCLQSEIDTDKWILDSGASKHMTYRRDFFCELQEYEQSENARAVSLGNKKEIKVHGYGNIMIKRYVNGQWVQSILENVLYVPDLRRNLFSEGMVTRKGYSIVKRDNEALILKENSVVMTATLKENNLYEINIESIVQEKCNLVESSLKIWHERLGHLNVKEVQNMSKNGAIPMILTDDKDFNCEACQYGKQSRLPFHKSHRGQCKPGEVTYSDVCGPLEHASMSGARYFILFKDGATSYRHLYIIKHKSDSLDCFKRYNAIVKNKFGHGTCILHTDNGREYVNREFREYLDREGIIHERTAPYTPEQNGRAEREMRTIMESARSMLYSRGISLNLWAEAVNCSVYLLNRSSSTQTKDVSPYELWNGKQPYLGHIKVFGSTGYVHIPDEKRKKLDKKSVKLLLVGYENENYRMLDIDSGKITISRNVCFDENKPQILKRDSVSIDLTNRNEENEVNDISILQALPIHNQSTELPETTIDDENVSDISYESTNSQNDPTYQPSQIISSDEERNITLRPRRQRNEEANICEFEVPNTYEEAIKCKDSYKWKAAIKEELQSLKENETWKLIDRNNEKTVTSKWVFCVKRDPEGNITRYKARLCARGFTQVKDVDFKETFSPTTRYDSIRVILSLAAQKNYEIQQFDVQTAFLYGELIEDVYMEVPEGVEAEQGKICKLIKSLYGLKQSSRCWNIKFSSFLTGYGFKVCPSDNCVFVGSFNSYKVILLLYVDDGLLVCECKDTLIHIINDLKRNFKIKVINLNTFVGMEITKGNNSIVISQRQYIKQIINKFNMSDANPSSTPADNNVTLIKNVSESTTNFPYREAVGALMFLATVSRPDISYSLNIVSRYLNNPSKDHVNAVKRIIKYLIKTIDICISYNCNSELIGYSDSDYASDIDSRKSNTGYIFMLNGGPVTWASRKQNTVALSTTESEYMAASEAAKETLWLRQLLIDVNEPQLMITLCIDNQSAIKLIHNPVHHKRTKHIDIRYNFIRENVQNNIIVIKYVPSMCQLADFFNKSSTSW